MDKYVKLSWPECQEFENNENSFWVGGTFLFVPEDDYIIHKSQNKDLAAIEKEYNNYCTSDTKFKETVRQYLSRLLMGKTIEQEFTLPTKITISQDPSEGTIWFDCEQDLDSLPNEKLLLICKQLNI